MRRLAILGTATAAILFLAANLCPSYIRACWFRRCAEFQYTNNDLSGLLKKANGGDDRAQATVAMKYMTGDGVEQNIEKSVELLRSAAEQGNTSAQYALGIQYLTGIHIRKDYVLGYKWLDLAAAQGHELSPDLLSFIEQSMTKDQIAESQRLARVWQPQKSISLSANHP